MTRQRISPRYIKGFSLIELMISLSIGLIITVASFSAYMGATGATRIAEAQGRMNEDAQAALTILTQQLRMAGNNPDQANRTDLSRRNPVYDATTFSIRGCDGLFSNITTASNIVNLTCSPDTTKPDSIAVSYEADVFNTVPTTGALPLPTDCLGNALSTITATFPPSSPPTAVSATYAVADNRFYVDLSKSIPSLSCKGNGGNSTPQPLVENIEDMQLTYGATATTDGTVAGYLNAEKVISETIPAPLTAAESWAKVLTVRICVLARSASAVVPDADSAHYIKCDGTLETAPPDRRLRRAYATTVVLRNRLPVP